MVGPIGRDWKGKKNYKLQTFTTALKLPFPFFNPHISSGIQTAQELVLPYDASF